MPYVGIAQADPRGTATLELARDFRSERHSVWGVTARNREQNFALNLLMDPEIDFVMLAKSQGIEGLKVTEPSELEAALRRGVDAMTAGEPYVLDVRVATVGAGADSTWHQRFKLRR